MVLLGGLIQFSIINTHTPSRDSLSRNWLIVLIYDDYHSPLLGYDVDRAYLLIIRDKVDNASFK